MVDKTKIIQCHLLTEVVVEVVDEIGKNELKVSELARLEKMQYQAVKLATGTFHLVKTN